MEAKVTPDGRIISVLTKEEREKMTEQDPIVIDALKTKLKVLDQELAEAHKTIETLEAEKQNVQDKLKKIVQGE